MKDARLAAVAESMVIAGHFGNGSCECIFTLIAEIAHFL